MFNATTTQYEVWAIMACGRLLRCAGALYSVLPRDRSLSRKVKASLVVAGAPPLQLVPSLQLLGRFSAGGTRVAVTHLASAGDLRTTFSIQWSTELNLHFSGGHSHELLHKALPNSCGNIWDNAGDLSSGSPDLLELFQVTLVLN